MCMLRLSVGFSGGRVGEEHFSCVLGNYFSVMMTSNEVV